ncbi:uncharacterized protein J3R85_014266 [Psidium guajava]|nr:uncharacterized protein J3R85_014266 [Psidium guajava]
MVPNAGHRRLNKADRHVQVAHVVLAVEQHALVRVLDRRWEGAPRLSSIYSGPLAGVQNRELVPQRAFAAAATDRNRAFRSKSRQLRNQVVMIRKEMAQLPENPLLALLLAQTAGLPERCEHFLAVPESDLHWVAEIHKPPDSRLSGPRLDGGALPPRNPHGAAHPLAFIGFSDRSVSLRMTKSI